MEKCIECGAELCRDETGLCKKLINKSTKKFMCIPCLGKYFSVSEEALKEKARQYREMGCSMFK